MRHLLLTLHIVFLACAIHAEPVADVPFAQYHREFFVSDEADVNDVRAVTVTTDGAAWIATAAGIYRLADGEWVAAMSEEDAGPAFDACRGMGGVAWFAAWNGVYRSEGERVIRVPDIPGPISAVHERMDGVIHAFGKGGVWRLAEGDWTFIAGHWADSVRDVFEMYGGDLWLATGSGVFVMEPDTLEPVAHYWRKDELRSSDVSALCVWTNGDVVIGGNNGLDVYGSSEWVRSASPTDGMPHGIVQALALKDDRYLLAGTPIGLAMWDTASAPQDAGDPDAAAYINPPWRLFHSKAWLPNDDVRDVALHHDGSIWVATAGGVSVLRTKELTLAEKEKHFREIVYARKLREPGLVESTRLMMPGDVSTSMHEDDDNDGEYTNHYMVMQALRYAVTGDSEAKQRAKDAFEALTLLQEVTNTSGFIARTLVPEAWADPGNPNPYRLHDRNKTYTPREVAARAVGDPRYKPVEVRWREAEKHPGWLWKGDTSSDEVTGHFFGYLFYYDLVAETEEEKEQVRAVCSRVMDYLIEGGYTFIDPIDGEHTRWGVWSPEKLYGDLDWLAERNINSLEMLSYLKTTHHITGEEKYEQAYRYLIEEHGYAESCRAPRRTEPAMFTHIDDCLLVLAFPALIRYEDDPELKAIYEEGLRQWFDVIDREYSPLFNFMAGWLGVQEVHPEACVAFLRDTPISLVQWTVDNTKREDIELVRWPELDHLQTSRLLPPSERGVMRWDKNPWSAVRGFGGHIESSGVYYLLPYWLGRYAGYIGAP